MIFQTETLESLLFPCFLLPLEWLDLGLGVPSAWEACLALENQKGPGCRPGKKKPEDRLLRPASELSLGEG